MPSCLTKGFVLPKGLLMPSKERTKGLEQSGVALAYQFSFLSFVPALQKNFRLRPMASPPSQIYVSDEAAQKVGLAPIAEDRDDLEFSVPGRRHRAFLDTVPHAAITDARMENEVAALLDKGAGLVVLPELVTSSSAVVNLAETLPRAARTGHSVILVGSGPSEERSKGLDRPFNEAVVMTGAGEVLFCQRKLFVGAINAAQHPALIAEATGSLPAPLNGLLAVFARRNTPCAGVGRCSRAACSKIALIGEHDTHTGFGRSQRRPSAGWATADHKHVRLQPQQVIAAQIVALHRHFLFS